MLSFWYIVPLPRRGINLKKETPGSPTEENEYHTLQAFLGQEGTGDRCIEASGTCSGDGEFIDVKKYAKRPFPYPQNERGAVRYQQNCVIGGIYHAMNALFN